MKVGDLIHMPGSPGNAIGVITRTNPDCIRRGTSHKRVRVLWLTDTPGEVSWEPAKWLAVLNESR